MKIMTINCPAGQAVTVGATGRYFRVLEADADVSVTFEFANGRSYRTPWLVGIGGSLPEKFTRLIIESSTLQEVQIGYSDTPIDDSRLNGSIQITGGIRSASNRTATYGNHTAGTSAAQIVGVNLSRGRSLIQNLGPGDLYLGTDSSVTTSSGLKVSVGGSAEITFESAIYGIATAAGTDVRFIEETL